MAKKKEKKLEKKVKEKKPLPKVDKKKSLPEKKKKLSPILEEDIEAISEKEIENFKIEGIDMEKLKNKILGLVEKRGDNGMFQSEVWKKVKLSSRDGSRLAVKLDRQNLVNSEMVLEDGRG